MTFKLTSMNTAAKKFATGHFAGKLFTTPIINHYHFQKNNKNITGLER
jgi:hypothetical protein